MGPGGTGGNIRCTLPCRWIEKTVTHKGGRKETKNPQEIVEVWGLGRAGEKVEGRECRGSESGRRFLLHAYYCFMGLSELDDSENGKKERD